MSFEVLMYTDVLVRVIITHFTLLSSINTLPRQENNFVTFKSQFIGKVGRRYYFQITLCALEKLISETCRLEHFGKSSNSSFTSNKLVFNKMIYEQNNVIFAHKSSNKFILLKAFLTASLRRVVVSYFQTLQSSSFVIRNHIF